MMASGIPTRRIVGRRADENAPPVQKTRASRLAQSTKPTLSTTTSSSSIPMLKRNGSSTIVVEASSSTAGTSSKPMQDTKKRSALGEVTNAPKNKNLDALKGKDGEEKEKEKGRPVARRTRSTIPAPAPVAAADKASGIPAAAKRKATAPPLSRTTTASRSRSTTAYSTHDEGVLRERTLNTEGRVKVEELEREPAPEPARKKRKTSSPVVDKEEVEEDNEDLADPGVYDEDGQEVQLSSGRKGTSLRSPKRSSRAKDEGWTDLDAEDEGDPAMVSEYVIDAFNYMMRIEQSTMPAADYMDKQAELKWQMRSVLMDWIIEVHSKFRLLPETLFIATNLIDRFLSARVVSVEKIQLVGITALFVASKYEEVMCPSIMHFLNMADGGYDVNEMLKAERYLLQTLDFDMSYPNPLHFLRRISKADGYDIQTRTVSKYLIEIGCLENRLLAFPPSLLAAAAMYLARLCLERGEWSPNLVHYSTYSVKELLPAAQVMLDYILDPDFNADTVFHRKYAGKKHMKSSVYVRQWALGMWPHSADGTSPDRGRELELELENW